MTRPGGKGGSGKSPPGALAPEDADLWQKIAGTARPLPGRHKDKAATGQTLEGIPVREPATKGKNKGGTGRSMPRAAHEPAEKAPPPLAPLEPRLRQHLARGRREVEARLDLHGMRRSEAQPLLLAFLKRSQAEGRRHVLVITGKGRSAAASGGEWESGILRREVPRWLALPQFRELVVAFGPAHGRHGGEGALYVQVRRPRQHGPRG